MCDLPAEFYLETVRLVFQEYALPRGQLDVARAARRSGGDPPHGAADVEGERDDICSLGQTLAAHDLCAGLAPVPASRTTCRPAPATTACSAASAGPGASIRSCGKRST